MTNPFDCVIDASDHIFHLNTYALHMYSSYVYAATLTHFSCTSCEQEEIII